MRDPETVNDRQTIGSSVEAAELVLGSAPCDAGAADVAKAVPAESAAAVIPSIAR